MRTVTIDGKEYGIMFDANVLAKIQKRYESVDCLAEKLLEIGELTWILAQAINEAYDYRRIIQHEDVDDEPMSETKLGMLLAWKDMYEDSQILQAVVDAFNDGMGGRKNPKAGRRKSPPGTTTKNT